MGFFEKSFSLLAKAKGQLLNYLWLTFGSFFFCFTFASHTLQAVPVVHVFGDSHSFAFISIPVCQLHWLGGITMHRVGRDGLSFINLPAWGVQEGQVAVFVFGEIDVRCHIGKQRDEMKRDVNEVIETLVTQYIYTILLNRSLYRQLTCVVYSIIPPADLQNHIDPPFYGTLQDRVDITQRLNARLAAWCELFGIEFLNVYYDYATPEGILRAEISDGGVHIAPAHNYAITQKLNQILIRHNVY